MPTRNGVLTDHQEELIDKLVGSGRYQNASEVLREGLRLVEQREAEDAAKLKALRKAGREGFDTLDRGGSRSLTASTTSEPISRMFRTGLARGDARCRNPTSISLDRSTSCHAI